MIRKFTFENFDLIKKILSQVSHLCHYMTSCMIYFAQEISIQICFWSVHFYCHLAAHFSINHV